MSDEQIIAVLNTISSNGNRILPVIFLLAGTFGHICNILIFSKRTQRSNPIAIYFLSSTIANILVVYLGVLIRYLQDNQNTDPVNNILVWCRLRSFVYYLALSLSNWYILLATIDRYLISSDSTRRRQLSSVRNACRIIAIVTIVFMLLYCHILVLYNIQTLTTASNTVQNYCYPQRGSYRLFSDIQILVQFSLLPPLLMSVFIILIIKNIHASHRRIANTVVAHHHARIKRRDVQLSKMLALQVAVIIFCSLPLAVSQLLTTMTLNSPKTPLRAAAEGFLAFIGRQLAFLNCSISFYLYTLSGSQFRVEIRQVFNQLSMCLCGRRLLEKNRIGVGHRPGDDKAQGRSWRPQHTPAVEVHAEVETTNNTADRV